MALIPTPAAVVGSRMFRNIESLHWQEKNRDLACPDFAAQSRGRYCLRDAGVSMGLPGHISEMRSELVFHTAHRSSTRLNVYIPEQR